MRGATFTKRLLTVIARRFDLEVLFGYECRQMRDQRLIEDAVSGATVQILDLAIQNLLTELHEGHLRVMQIGANDGFQNDFMQRWYEDQRVMAILVEPQREAYARLVDHYHGNDRVFPMNCAVTRTGESLRLYRFSKAQENNIGIDVLASFDQSHLVSWKQRLKIDSEIVSEEYPSQTIQMLLDKMKWSRADALIIDTEGYDFEILLSLEQLRNRPRIVVFEHINLTMPTQLKAIHLMKSLGYAIQWGAQDAFCILPASR